MRCGDFIFRVVAKERQGCPQGVPRGSATDGVARTAGGREQPERDDVYAGPLAASVVSMGLNWENHMRSMASSVHCQEVPGPSEAAELLL